MTENKITTNISNETKDEVKSKKFASVVSLFENRLCKKDLNQIQIELKKRFALSKSRQVFKKRIRRHGCARTPGLSNTQRKSLGLFNLKKNEFLYKDLLPLNSMWKSYMDNYLNIKNIDSFGNILSPNYEETMQQLYKADYHGAYVRVSKSTSAPLVGIEGIIVFETKNVLKLLGKDNILRSVPKHPCEFKLSLGNFEMSFLGKNLMVKPTERSIRKLKGFKAISL